MERMYWDQRAKFISAQNGAKSLGWGASDFLLELMKDILPGHVQLHYVCRVVFAHSPGLIDRNNTILATTIPEQNGSAVLSGRGCLIVDQMTYRSALTSDLQLLKRNLSRNVITLSQNKQYLFEPCRIKENQSHINMKYGHNSGSSSM
ncbi:hypothetical protein CEXT_546801 [Caerostris extrusa]|uniref:Uncharacterized protein n=1 Tax=Caerostris extrusa TaxID=172846 RepID=A0AAV4Y7V5_CAEEX|nr:hypothetical protein CEXT_546801 [Caerostris extrusa]